MAVRFSSSSDDRSSDAVDRKAGLKFVLLPRCCGIAGTSPEEVMILSDSLSLSSYSSWLLSVPRLEVR